MKWYWKLYLLLLLLAGYGQMLRKILTDTGGFSSRYSAAIVATLLVVSLVAKLRELPILKRWLWQVLSIVLGLACVLGGLFVVYLTLIGVYYSAGLLTLAVLLLLPATGQIYQYAYKSPLIWANSTHPPGNTDNVTT